MPSANPADRNGNLDHEEWEAAEKCLSRLAKATRLDRNVLIGKTIRFAASKEEEFIAFAASRAAEPQPRRSRFRRWLSIPKGMELLVFTFAMFIIGMILSIAVLVSRK